MSERRSYDRRQSPETGFVGFIHQSHYADLVASNARWEWQNAWRRARKAGMAHMPCVWILAKYPSIPAPMEVGCIEGFRFIESKR